MNRRENTRRSHLRILALSVSMATLAACGGGGGSSSPEPVTLTGVLSAPIPVQTDRDINDLSAPFSTNNAIAQAQPLSRNGSDGAVAAGFVTAAPTGQPGQRFQNAADLADFYEVSLAFGDVITLEFDAGANAVAADFQASTADLTAQADLDMFLYNEAGGLVSFALSADETTELILNEDDEGRYFIEVAAFAGAANYTLSIGPQLNVPAVYRQVNMATMAVSQLSVERTPQTKLGRRFAEDHGGSPLGAGRFRQAFVGSRLDGVDAPRLMQTMAQSAGMRVASSLSARHAQRTRGRAAGAGDDAAQRLALVDVVRTLNKHEGTDVFKIMHRLETQQLAPTDPVPDAGVQWNLFQVGWDDVDAAGDFPAGLSPIIAVLDGGFLTEHPEIAPVLADEREFLTNNFFPDAQHDADPNVATDPITGNPCHVFHGTHVASTAVAPQGNGGFVGVYPGAQLMALKVGSDRRLCRLIDPIWTEALKYAAGVANISGAVPPMPAAVANLSFGGPNPTTADQAAIDEAVAAGLIVVASAGNNGDTALGQFPLYPGAYEGVISVGSTDLTGDRAFYSSFFPQVDIAAPGGDGTVDADGDGNPDGVLGAIATPNASLTGFDNTAAFYQGTSMAAPHVAAGVALMRAIAPNLTQAEVEAFLTNGALTEDASAPGHDNEFGYGVMSLPRMVAAAEDFNVSGAPEAKTTLGFSPSPLDFGAHLTVIEFGVGVLGDGAVSVTGVVGDDVFGAGSNARLRVEEVTLAGDGTGRYRLFINRGGLAPGVLTGVVGFTLSDGETAFAPVRVEISTAAATALSTAPLIVELQEERAAGFVTVETRSLPSLNDLGASLSFEDAPAGDYRLVYGTDMDGDGEICDPGELCGRYPSPFSGAQTFSSDQLDVALTLDYEVVPDGVLAPQ